MYPYTLLKYAVKSRKLCEIRVPDIKEITVYFSM